MEITFELFNTLQNLEKGGFYKEADRLTNLIHKIYANLLESNLRFAAKPGNSRNTTRRSPVKMNDLRGPNSPLSKPVSLETPRPTLPEQLLPQSPVAPSTPVAPVAPVATSAAEMTLQEKTLLAAKREEELISFYLQKTEGLSNSQKIKWIEKFLQDRPIWKPFSRMLVHDVLAEAVKNNQNISRLVKNSPNVSAIAVEKGLITPEGAVTESLSPFKKVFENAAKGQATAPASAAEKAVATVSNEAKALGALETAANTTTTIPGAQATTKAVAATEGSMAELNAALSAAAAKVPILGKVKDLLGKAAKWLGPLFMLSCTWGIIHDVNKYGMEKVWADNNLRSKFIQNLVEFGSAAAVYIPMYGAAISIALMGLGYLIGRGREESEQRSKDFGSGEYREARDFAYEEIKKNPKITVDNLKNIISSRFFKTKANDVILQEQYDRLVSEFPQMISTIATGLSKFGPNAKWAQIYDNNYRFAENYSTAPSLEECNRAVINGIMKSLRTAEKLEDYQKVDELVESIRILNFSPA